MSSTAIFWPLIVQTILIYVVYLLVVTRRVKSVKEGKARASDFKIPTMEPEPSATAARNLINQFELPLLFYVVCILLHLVNAVSYLVLVLAWLFVITRIVHMAVHTTSNKVRIRRPIFVLGFVVNGLLWIYLAWKLATA
jgi:hypothetical protein